MFVTFLVASTFTLSTVQQTRNQMHLASALTCLRFKFRLGVISSFGLVSFRHFAWLFLSFRVAFSRHFVFSRRKDAITPREKKHAIIKKSHSK